LLLNNQTGSELELVDHIDWNDLLAKAQKGDVSAQNELIRNLDVRLRPVAKYRLVGWRHEEVEDLLQDTLTTVFEKIQQIDSNPDHFALQVLRNKIGNAYQRWQRRKNVVYRIESQQDNGEASPMGERTVSQLKSEDNFAENIEARDMVDYVTTAIKLLPKFCQTVFLGLLSKRTIQVIWRHFQEHEPDLSRNAFDKRIYDCRKKLTELVEGQV